MPVGNACRLPPRESRGRRIPATMRASVNIAKSSPESGILGLRQYHPAGRQRLDRRPLVRVDLPPLPIRHEESVLSQEIDLLRMHGFGWRREPPASGCAVGHQVNVDLGVAEECNADG